MLIAKQVNIPTSFMLASRAVEMGERIPLSGAQGGGKGKEGKVKYGGTIIRDFNPLQGGDMDSSRHVLLVNGGRGDAEKGDGGDGAEVTPAGKAGTWTDRRKVVAVTCAVSFLLFALAILGSIEVAELEGSAWSAIALPYSTVSPVSLGFTAVDRPQISSPGPIFKNLVNRNIPLPTNSWCENFFLGTSNVGAENKVFQVTPKPDPNPDPNPHPVLGLTHDMAALLLPGIDTCKLRHM